MKYKFFLIVLILLLSSCSEKQTLEMQSSDTELNKVIKSYFSNFNDVYKWSAFATDEYIKRVYIWCSGDETNSKSIEEMKQIYMEISKKKAQLKNYHILNLNKISDSKVELKVDREWSSSNDDSTTYSIIKIHDSWKFDDRF